MREIKFRAWDKTSSEMKVVKEIYLSGMGVEVWNGDDTFSYLRVGKHELMQYTGIKDKNGKEIYEGDIIKVGNNEPSEIIYNKEYVCFETRIADPYSKDYVVNYWGNYGEVIGNIYQNPELLKQ